MSRDDTDHHGLRRGLEELRRLRDELRVQAHLSRMDAREVWDDLEERWKRLEAQATHLTRESKGSLDHVGEAVHKSLSELREGYGRLASALREVHPDSLWDQLRASFDRLVEGGQRATEHLVGSFEELGDAAKVRVERVRLERTLIKKYAELGAHVYEVAQLPRLPDGTPPQILDHARVKTLLQELGSLNADLEEAVAELAGRDRAEDDLGASRPASRPEEKRLR